MNFKTELQERTNFAETVIEKFLPAEQGFSERMAKAVNYSMRAGGKRLRPVFMRETYHILGGEGEIIEPFMAALEMIHTHSLIHDDLPALDNDEYRRGKQTTHIVFGEAAAILAGDALLNYAYETAFCAFDMAKDDLDNDEYRRGKQTTHIVFGEAAAILAGDALLNYAYETAFCAFDMAKDEKEFHRVAKALKVLAQKTGIKGMLGGQGVDVENDGKPLEKQLLDYIYELKVLAQKTGIKGMLGGQGVDVENDGKPLEKQLLDYIYENKTSALIEAALMIGGILAGYSDIEKLEKIGSKIGIAFQIQDDILDVISSEEELGKPIGSDEKNNKTTYVTLEGIEKAGNEVQKLTDEAVELLREFAGEKNFLEELFQSLCARRK